MKNPFDLKNPFDMKPPFDMKTPYEVPAEMRDFAERSVSQARKAFETFMGAVQKSATGADDMAQSAATSARDAGVKTVDFAQKSVNAAFDLAEKMVHAKDAQEVFTLQADYLKAQYAALQEQSREFGEAIQKATGLKK